MVQVIHHHSALRFSRSETQRVVAGVIRHEKKKLKFVSVVFVGSRFIRRVNKNFLKHDYVTDVISFPLQDDVGADAEIYINLDRAKSQAKEYKVSFRQEVLRLVVHGILHLLGYNDKTAVQKRRMQIREDIHLSRLTKG